MYKQHKSQLEYFDQILNLNDEYKMYHLLMTIKKYINIKTRCIYTMREYMRTFENIPEIQTHETYQEKKNQHSKNLTQKKIRFTKKEFS